MTIRSNRTARGLTLIELMVAALAGVVLVVAVSAMLYHGHVGFRTLFRRVNSDVVRNAYETRRTFDVLVRRASIRRCDLADGNNTLYVYYFTNPQNMVPEDPDRYAKFYLNASGTEMQLKVDQGRVLGNFSSPTSLPTLEAPNIVTMLAHNVTAPASGIFSRLPGNVVRMVLILDNETTAPAGVSKLETLKMTLTSEAVRHNP